MEIGEEYEGMKGRVGLGRDSVKFARLIAERGVDLIDVSSGGNHPKEKKPVGAGYQSQFAKDIKKAVGDKMAAGTVRKITSGVPANQLLEGGLDLAIFERTFQKNAGPVWTFAEELGVEITAANQMNWGFGGKAGAPPKK